MTEKATASFSKLRAHVALRAYTRAYTLVILAATMWLVPETFAIVMADLRIASFTLRSIRANVPDGSRSHLLSTGGPYEGALTNAPTETLTGPTLYLVSTKNCPSCEPAIEAWRRALAMAGVRGMNLWLVSDDDRLLNTETLRSGADSGVTLTASGIADPMRFMSFTGITAAPVAVAFRTADEYLCVVAGIPPHERATDCIRAVVGGRRVQTVPLFTRYGTLTPIRDPGAVKAAAPTVTELGGITTSALMPAGDKGRASVGAPESR